MGDVKLFVLDFRILRQQLALRARRIGRHVIISRTGQRMDSRMYGVGSGDRVIIRNSLSIDAAANALCSISIKIPIKITGLTKA